MSRSIAQAVASYNTPVIRFNWGFNDGAFDAEMNHVDRRTIAPGELFQLKHDTEMNRAYSAGYDAGFSYVAGGGNRAERAKDAVREAANASYQETVANG
jgi:hypothetical protein